MKKPLHETGLTSPTGKLEIDGDRATLVFERTIAHPPEAVWAALTDPDRLRQWFMTTAKIDGRPGGSVDMVSGPAQFHWTGRILTWDPPRVLEYEWNAAARPELPSGEETVVRWELTRAGASTVLKLTHRRLTKPTAMGFAPGWHAFLDRLSAHLDEAPLPDWMQRFAEVQIAYAAANPGC